MNEDCAADVLVDREGALIGAATSRQPLIVSASNGTMSVVRAVRGMNTSGECPSKRRPHPV
jgi:hypothetical protein